MPKKMRITVVISSLVALLMFGFSFALIPLYNTLCKIGFSTSVRIEGNSSLKPDLSRSINVQFIATNNRNLSWEFYPNINSINVHPDENNKIIFFAKNNTPKTITVQAIVSFAPRLAAQHFHKTECFCFTRQTLKAGEAKYMPVIFQIDKDIPADINTITLAYTLFDVTPNISQKDIR